MKAYLDFLKIALSPYNYNEYNKERWGQLGKRFLKELAGKVGAQAVKISFNRSGIIDRGYVTGFLKKNNKFVYISISDSSVVKGMEEVLYRIAKDKNDYTGGANNYFKLGSGIERLIEALNNMLK